LQQFGVGFVAVRRLGCIATDQGSTKGHGR
jgi:hypothetical protein